jgi:DHA1 family multidrug resistance protein-like MFS transporter
MMARFSREFYLLTAFATIIYISGTIISPFFSLYVNEKETSSFELGLIISIMSYTTLLIRMPLGMLSSKIGNWWVIPIALLGQSFSYILYSQVTNPIHFYPIRIFHAISIASLHPTLMSLVSVFSPKNRKGEAVGTFLTSVGLGTMGGPFLCSFLLSYFDYETILKLSSILPLIAFIIYIGLLKIDALSKHLSRSKKREVFIDSSWNRIKRIITIRQVQMLTYVRFTFAFTAAIIATLYSVYAVNTLKIIPAVYALLVTLRGFANAITRVPAGRISDMIGRKKPLLISFALLTLVFLLFSTIGSPITIGLVMILYGIAHGIRAVSEWSLLADVVPTDDQSLANFYFACVFDLGSAFGATFAGVIAMILPTPIIYIFAAFLVSSSIIVIAFNKVH